MHSGVFSSPFWITPASGTPNMVKKTITLRLDIDGASVSASVPTLTNAKAVRSNDVVSLPSDSADS
eukprot:11341262-Alexandrium_andersonii.AAC.1